MKKELSEMKKDRKETKFAKVELKSLLEASIWNEIRH